MGCAEGCGLVRILTTKSHMREQLLEEAILFEDLEYRLEAIRQVSFPATCSQEALEAELLSSDE